jgi:crotonobetainyl-CoA:carnitine CoA-transferase CaiB-like acyl-CoA transferase
VFHALSGELSRSGIPEREPLLPPGELGMECAATQAATLALVAYWQRLRTGVGDHLDFSLLDGASQALDPGYGIAGSATAGVPASQLPRGRPEARFQYPILPCKDGFVRLCILAPRQWLGMFEWMGRPEQFADPEMQKTQVRFANRELMPALAQFFADKTRTEIEAEAQHHGVAAAAVLDLDEALTTEQMQARRAFAEVALAPGLTAPFPDGIMEIDGVRMGIAGPPPGLPEPGVEWRPRPSLPAAPTAGERPFAGLAVLDLGVIVVGAETGRLLGDHGADVIKVESAAFIDGARQSRTGDPMTITFATGNRNKRSVGINLRDPKGRELLLDLVRRSDVVLSNFKGGTLQSLGIDYETLRAVNPGVILTDSSAYGPTGPWAKRMGYGPLVRASAGLTMQWRYPGEPDSFSDAITVYPDHVGARVGALGLVALLIRRLLTGEGGYLGVSQAEIILAHMAPQVAANVLDRAGHAVHRPTDQSAVYRCAGDDEWCVVTIRDQRDEQAAMRVTQGRPLSDWMRTMEPATAMEALQGAGVPAGAMLRVADLPAFEYYRQRDLYRDVTNPYLAEGYTVETRGCRSEHLPDAPEHPAPLLGEHTIAVVAERLGLTAGEIEGLLTDKVLERTVA